MTKFYLICVVFCIIKQTYVNANNDNQPKIRTITSGLILEAAYDRNITLRVSRESSVLLNGVDIMQKIIQQYTPTNFDSTDSQDIYLPPAKEITFAVQLLAADIERLENQFALLQNRATSQSKLNEIRRCLRRVILLNARLKAVSEQLETSECGKNIFTCKHGGTCYDSYLGYHCECPEGWTGKTCEEDVNECNEFAGTDLGCQNNAACINTLGGYRCECTKGFAGANCRLRNLVCQQSQSEELCGHGICVPANNQQGYTCICNQGWSHNLTSNSNSTDAITCNVDVNECEESKNPCHRQCINLPGGFKCGPCPVGYTGNGLTCHDIDECTTNNGGCSLLPKVRCINTEGSYRCGNCPPGWIGDGHTCELEPTNSCDAENICHPQAKCEYISGIATCTCLNGMYGHGFGTNGCHTTPITDSCQNHICKNNGTCIATGRSTSCLCPLGFSGALCETVDGCHPNPCENSGTCKPLENQSFKCSCQRGTTGKRCEVIRSVCNSIQRWPEGELSYPSDGAPEYSPYERCAWLMRTAPMNVLNITFTKFDVQEDPECSKDWLQIHDGNSLASQLIGRFCGHQLPLGGNIVSSSHQVFFWFRSDNATNRPGFHMTWKSQPHVCGEAFELGSQGEGVIRSPGYPGKSSTNRECQWKLSAPYGFRFILRIYEVTTGTMPNCTGDTLNIYDSDILLEQFCTSMSPQPLRSSSNIVRIHLHTDTYNVDSSFQLHYEVESSIPHCGGEFTEASGYIVGPTAGSVCIFLIHQPLDTQIQLEFVELQPFGIENCNFKSIEVFDGRSDEESLLASLCNNKFPDPVLSSSNYILIRYKNKLQTENHIPPFRVKYTRVCNFKFFGPESGEFSTPNYPYPYTEKLTCTFHIYGPVETVVHANFTDFSIAETKQNTIVSNEDALLGAYNNKTVTDDLTDDSKTYVDVYLSESNKVRYFKGSPMEITSELNKMTIIFHATLNPNKARGFYVVYSFESIPCGGVYTEPEGSFNKRFDVGDECKFIFEAPKGMDIRIAFGLLSHENGAQVLIYGNSTGDRDYLLKNVTSFMFFDHTFHFDVITIFTRGNAYLHTPYYEFLQGENVCGGNFITLSGIIKSPGWPAPYAANLDCVWTITAPIGIKIELEVQNFTLETTCTGDTLEIRNGQFSDSPLIGRYCGNAIPSRIPSFTNSMYLRFTSDNSVESAGFYMTWEQSETGCGGKLTSFKGAIHPPVRGDSRDISLSDISCDWTIHAAQGSSIVVNIMATTDSLSFCNSNNLQIFDGITKSKPLLHLNCSEAQNSGLINVTSSSNEILVVYTPRSDGKRYFILDYETKCDMVLDHVQGVIESPNFPDFYPEMLNCNWDIKAGANNKIKLAFSHFSLEAENMECEYDYVEVLDMKNEDILQKYRFCTEIPAPISSEGDRLVVRFVTDYSNSKYGFRAEYSRIGCGEVLWQESGRINSPNYPYGVDLDCDWYIEVPSGKQIVFTLVQLQIDSDKEDCSSDALTVKESKNAPHSLFKVCSTQQTSSVVTTPTNQLYLNFRTGPLRSQKFFKAYYNSKDASCGGVLSATSGLILSPNYPRNSTQAIHCKWLINVPSAYGIVLDFKDFEMQNANNCLDAYLKMIQKSGQTEKVLQQFCDSNLTDIGPIRDRTLTIEFMSKGSPSWGRFAIEFSKQCGKVIVDGSGYISSSADESCVWIFSVTEGSLISLNILEFECYCSRDDATPPKTCPNYFAVVGTSEEDIESNGTYKYCNSHISNLVYDKTELYVFATNINFRATYSTIQHSCGGMIYSAQGTLVSPYYPETYPPDVDCIWSIHASTGNIIEIEIVEIDIASSPHCNEHYLEISQTTSAQILGVLCGNTLPEMPFKADQIVEIRFHSSIGSTGKGFKLNWKYAHLHEIQNSTEGTIKPPPLKMVQSQDEPYAWRILVDRERFITLYFEEYIDGLKLYDGFDETALPVDIPESPWSFVSSSNVVFLQTDNAKLQHFFMKWHITNNKVLEENSTLSECHTELFIKYNLRPTITSPGFPYGYKPNMMCDWILKPEKNTYHVVIIVYDAHLEITNDCHADYLKISTSADLMQWHEMEKLCNSSKGSVTPIATVHGTPNIKLDFVSDATMNKTGFQAIARAECGANLTDSVGFINGNSIRFETKCLWQINVAPTKRIRLQLDFAPNITGRVNDCMEYALIYDGIDEHAPLLAPGKICSFRNVSRLVLNTTSSSVAIKYSLVPLRPSRPLLPQRWNLTYREYSECNEEYRLIPQASVINVSSPSYPNIPHPYSECEWRIIAPRGELIRVEFVDRFDMNSRYCAQEYVEVFDGSTSLAKSLGRFCRKPTTLITTQNVLYMRYQTNIPEPRSGFRARISLSKCGGSYNEASSNIASPGYPRPGAYPSSSQCDYVINMPADATIRLVMADVHLPFNNKSLRTSDFLEILSVGMDFEPVLVYGNTTKGTIFDFNANSVIVRFHTFAKTTEYRGFMIKYNRYGDSCNQDISGESGVVTMHFPKRAYFETFCRWKITVPKGQRVKLEFLNLNDLKKQNSTRYPTFAIYNDHDLLSLLEIIYVSDYSPSTVFESSDNLMMVRINVPMVNFQFKTIRARYSSEETSACPRNIDDNNPTGLIDIQDIHPQFQGYYYCLIKTKLNGKETLVFNITSFVNTHKATAPMILAPLVFREQTVFTTYSENLTAVLQPHVQPEGVVRIIQTEFEHIQRLRIEYRRHKCGGAVTIGTGNVKLEKPAAVYTGYGPLMCVWTLEKFSWGERAAERVYLSGNFTFSDSCEREYVFVQENSWKNGQSYQKFCRDNGQTLSDYILEKRYTYVVYRSEEYNHEKTKLSIDIRKGTNCHSLIKVSADQASSMVEVRKDLYQNNLQCTWIFFPPTGYFMQIQFFDRFFIEYSPNCTKDYLEIRRLDDSLWVPEARFCGRQHPEVFNTTANRIQVVWQTDNNVTADGFSFFVRSQCSVTLNVTSTVQRIHSPNDGRQFQCEYIFQTNETKNLIKASVNFSQVPYRRYRNNRCTYNGFVASKLDEDGEEQTAERRCGMEFEERAYKYLKLSYTSEVPARFTIEYSLDTCGGNITSSPTTIRPLQHVESNKYADNMHCVWIVKAPVEHSIAIRFKYFETELNFDHVSIYLGSKIQEEKRLSKLTGNYSEPPTIMVDHNEAVINAESDISSSGKGFEAQIDFLKNCNERISLTNDNSHVSLVRVFKVKEAEEYLCVYRVTAPRGHRIEMVLKKNQINNSTSDCYHSDSLCQQQCNAIEMFDSVVSQQVKMARYCGPIQTNTTLLSSYEDAMIKFEGKLSGVYNFEIMLTMKKSSCGEITDYKIGDNEDFKMTFPPNGELYEPNIHCTWLLRSEKAVLVHFTYIDLQNISQVTGKCLDYVEVKGRYEIMQHCGKATNFSRNLDNYGKNEISITFHSDAMVQSKGFEVIVSTRNHCNKTYDQLNGIIKYEFMDNVCNDTIVVPENYSLSLYFDYMRFNDYNCDKSHLRITDLKTNKILIDRCGNSYFHIDLFTTTNAVRLEATKIMRMALFYAANRNTSLPGCGAILTSSSGYLSNPTYDNDRNFSECRWDIIVPSPNKVQVSFREFNMGPSTNCPLDNVKLIDVSPDGTEKIFKTLCGSPKIPDTLTSNSNHLAIISKKSPNFDGLGWNLYFSIQRNYFSTNN